MTKSTKELQKARRSFNRSSKKPYVRPHLVEYGNVAKLTTSGSGAGSDGLSTTMQIMV